MLQEAEQGGVTHLVDNAQLTPMLDEGMREKMEALGVRYIRLLSDASERGTPTFYNGWQDAFSTASLPDAFDRAAAAGSQLEWHSDGARLRHTVRLAPPWKPPATLARLPSSQTAHRPASRVREAGVEPGLL